MFDNLTKKLNLNQLSLILLKGFQIDEVSICPSSHISAQCRVLHFQTFVALISKQKLFKKIHPFQNHSFLFRFKHFRD